METLIKESVKLLNNSKHTIAFTGSGISVESGIPSFRGVNGIWTKYDPMSLELSYFFANPKESWSVIKEIFYDYFGLAKFNRAHEVLGQMEKAGMLACVITQNIDNLHQEAGNTIVHEFHGNSKKLVCTSCHAHFDVDESIFLKIPPTCHSCDGLLKPDFIFFGEQIPPDAYMASTQAAEKAEVCLVIGTTGEVMPANQIPVLAKQSGATIIEVNPEKSMLTDRITDIWLQGKASEVMDKLAEYLFDE
ncbi:MAG: NAD-dependent deacylase [Bacteroidota bacterium]|nr:NAD-dependent deacylase [Bacteroidota bacterium]